MADRYWRGGTGTWNGTNTVNWASTSAAATFTASRAAAVLTVTAVTSGTIAVGDTVWHTNGTSIGTISSFGTGSGGTGTYNMSASGTVSSRTMSSATTAAAVPTASDNVIFDSNSNVGTATFTVTVATATALCTDFTASGLDATMTFAGSTGTTVSGSFSVPSSNFSWTNTGTLTFNSTTTGKTITSNTQFIGCPITFNGVGGGWQLVDALRSTSSRTCTLTNGALDLNGFTLTTGLFSSSNSNTRSITTGTGGKISLNGNNGTIWTTSTVTGLTITGTLAVDCTYSGGTGTRTITTGALSLANSINFNITAGTDIVALTSAAVVRNLIWTGFAGTHTLVATTIYGNLTFSTGMTVTGAAVTHTYGATSGTQVITTNGKTYDCTITLNGVGGTFQLAGTTTMGSTRTLTLTNGALDLQTFTLTTNIFSSDNSNTRSITFGSGSKIVVTGSGATVWSAATTTGLTITGTPRVEFTYSGGVGTRTIGHGNTGGTEARSISVYVTAGTDILAITTAIRILDFTGFSGSLSSSNRTIYGNLVLSSTMTVTSGAQTTTFGATSGTQQVTTNGVSFGQNFYVSAPGATVQLQGALIVDSARTITLVDGTLDTNDLSVSCGSLAITGTNTRTLDFGSSDITVLGSGATAVNANVITGLTISYTAGASVIMSSAVAKTFVGGGASWPALVQGGAGALTITGSNTFADISNTTQPVSVLFTAGTTSTFTAFSLSGTLGNLVTIGSVTAASHALSKASGTVSVNYCTISRSDAAGGATWNASTSFGNVDGGNNTGWNFASMSATNRPMNVGMVNAGVATLDQFSAGTAFMGWGN
jgi:hypothetical protein